MKENKNNNISQQGTANPYTKSKKKMKRVGVAEGKLPDLDLDKFNSVGVEELFNENNNK